jgi:hypothetical protein
LAINPENGGRPANLRSKAAVNPHRDPSLTKALMSLGLDTCAKRNLITSGITILRYKATYTQAVEAPQ